MHKKQKLHILPVYEIALADAFFKITPQYFLNVLIERQKVSLEPQKSSHKRSKENNQNHIVTVHQFNWNDVLYRNARSKVIFALAQNK